MAYFPMFIDMHARKILLVGGGVIAAEKLEKLVDFTQDIHIISKAFNNETAALIEANGLTMEQRPYKIGDIMGYDIVIVATDDIDLQRKIYEESRGSRTLVNAVDNTDYCDFIFPSYIKRDDLTIAFSTGGASPAFAKRIRQHFEKVIPNSIGEFLQQMKILRSTMPKGKARMEYFEKLVETYFQKNFKS